MCQQAFALDEEPMGLSTAIWRKQISTEQNRKPPRLVKENAMRQLLLPLNEPWEEAVVHSLAEGD